MSRLDYSKWDHIEVSDDEDDTHPNIDTPSLFRWRHQARVDRMKERDQEWEALNKGKEEYQKKLNEVEKKLKKSDLKDGELKKVLLTKEELAKQEADFRKKEEELRQKDKETPWNIDTICKEGFSKSILNKEAPKEKEAEDDEDEAYEKQRQFQEKYKKELQHYGMLSKADESRKYLQDNPYLVCDKSANYLCIWCIDLAVAEKDSLMERVAHQAVILQFVLQLASQMKTDPRNCYNAFFNRFENLNADYMESFYDELNAFKGRVKERAQARLDDAMKRYEEEQRKQEIGPGGLHPADVMETLPRKLAECFESQDIPMLRQVIKEMDPDQAAYHMKRCVDSGLWVPNADGDSLVEEPTPPKAAPGAEEATYETVPEAPQEPDPQKADGTEV